MSKTAKPKQDDKEQSKRLVEDAKRHEVDKSGKPFEKAIQSIFAPRKVPNPKQHLNQN